MKLIFPFFLCWVLPTLLIFHLPVPGNISSLQLSLTFYLFVGLYLLLASSLSFWLVNSVVVMSKRTLYINGGAVIGILALLFWYGRTAEPFALFLSSLSTANLLYGATLLGAGLSVAIKRLGELVPVCLTAAAADLTSVVTGPTKKMTEELTIYYQDGLKGEPPLVDSVLIKAGVPGHDIPIPLFGVSDWILLILLSTALIRLNKSDNLLSVSSHGHGYLYLPVTTLALYVSLLAAQLTNLFLPAMVFICFTFLLYLVFWHGLHREMKKVDILNSLVFPCLAVTMILLLGR